MIRRTLIAFAFVALVLFVIRLGGGRGVASLVFGWLVLGYLVWCALPQLRRHFRFIMDLLPVAHRKGDHL